MKKQLLSAMALALLAAGSVRAQGSKFSLGVVGGYVPLRAQYPDYIPTTHTGTGIYPPGYELHQERSQYALLALSLGFDQPLYQFGNHEQSLGVSLNAGAGIFGATNNEVTGLNLAVLYDFPEYLTYRYGARASRKAKHDFGLGVGVGYRYGRFALPFQSPSAMLEGVYSIKAHSDMFLRLSADLRPTRYYSYYSSEGLVEALSLQEFALTLGASF